MEGPVQEAFEFFADELDDLSSELEEMYSEVNKHFDELFESMKVQKIELAEPLEMNKAEEATGTFLPTELVTFIGEFLYEDRALAESTRSIVKIRKAQKDLYSFCLVCRQWNQVGIDMLYRYPELSDGNSFELFFTSMRRISNKNVFGPLVQFLDLTKMVHQCSNSQTARLLSMTRRNLKEFMGPRIGFSINCLSAMGKCEKLTYLDLTLVQTNKLTFDVLKKNINNLSHLKSVILPTGLQMIKADNVGHWPLGLEEMSIWIGDSFFNFARTGPDFDRNASHFDWPPGLKKLTIRLHSQFAAPQMQQILNNPCLSGIKKLFIEAAAVSGGDVFEFRFYNDVLIRMHSLEHLEMTYELFFWFHRAGPDLDIRVLPSSSVRSLVLMNDFLNPLSTPKEDVVGREMLDALDGPFRNVLSLCSCNWKFRNNEWRSSIHKQVMSHLDELGDDVDEDDMDEDFQLEGDLGFNYT